MREHRLNLKKLSEIQIEKYLDTLEYIDKAGAYGIQRYGSLLIESVKGDFFNVIGLPISRLYDVLDADFDVDF